MMLPSPIEGCACDRETPNPPRSVSYFTQYRCRDCGGQVAFKSRPRNFRETYLLPLLQLRPVRCADCFRREYRPLTVPARDRNPDPPTDSHTRGGVA